MWQGINFALESTKFKKSMPLTVKNVKNELMSDPQVIADNFVAYFEVVSDKTRNKIKPPLAQDNKYLDHLHKNKPVDEYFVLYDIKMLSAPLSPEMAHIINISMATGYVSTRFKVVKLTSVFKNHLSHRLLLRKL